MTQILIIYLFILLGQYGCRYGMIVKIAKYYLIYWPTGQTDRPKSQCEQHRDSLQSGPEQGGQPNFGGFIPQCDSDGRYRPLQVGTDWCMLDC